MSLKKSNGWIIKLDFKKSWQVTHETHRFEKPVVVIKTKHIPIWYLTTARFLLGHFTTPLPQRTKLTPTIITFPPYLVSLNHFKYKNLIQNSHSVFHVSPSLFRGLGPPINYTTTLFLCLMSSPYILYLSPRHILPPH